MVTNVLATASPARAAAARSHEVFPIGLYQSGGSRAAGIGQRLHEIARQLPTPPSQTAWDFLSVALAVFGTDRFLPRSGSPDGWTRMLSITIEVADPETWAGLAQNVSSLLRFLTGDIWSVQFEGGGSSPPDFPGRRTGHDCVCLFSGGLDSFIGAADLVAAGRHPYIVSEAFPKEGPVQMALSARLGLANSRFAGQVIERFRKPYEQSSRSRSLLFLAYGTLVADSLLGGSEGPIDLYAPENGLIAINPPFTRRRAGSLSTRTMHPHFIVQLQRLMDTLGLGVRITNPFQHKTKGELLADCKNDIGKDHAVESYSCGKGKRINMHCGRCIPCLIRRAAFHRASILDTTSYKYDNLATVGDSDDVFAARFAADSASSRDVRRWANEPGPLPILAADRAAYEDVVRRGLDEVGAFLQTVAWR